MTDVANVRNYEKSRLLAMLLGDDLAGELAGMPLTRLFGFTHQVRQTEAEYLAAPVLESALELVGRALLEDITAASRDILDAPNAVRDWLRVRLAPLPYEVFMVLLLDSQHRLIDATELFRGTLTQTSVHAREVVKLALSHNAANVILAHNHPSGVAEPSRADECLTQLLKQALALVDVRVVDHFIVAGTSSPLSFAERGLL